MTKQKQGPTNSPELEAYKEQAKHSVNATLAPLTLLLKAHRIRQVRIVYAGGGDSGQIEEIGFVRYGSREPIDGNEAGLTLQQTERLERFVYDALEVRGWEVNNEGSQGTMIWNIDKDTFTHEHTNNMYGDCVFEHDHTADGADCESEVVEDPEGGYVIEGAEDLEGRIEL